MRRFIRPDDSWPDPLKEFEDKPTPEELQEQEEARAALDYFYSEMVPEDDDEFFDGFDDD